MTDVQDLLDETTSKLEAEAKRLRDEIAAREQAFEGEIASLRDQLRFIDQAIARIEGKPPAGSPSRSDRAPRGHNRTLILKALKANPGMTAAEISEATGITKATVFATLAKLTQDGKVRKKQTTRGVEHTLK